MKKAMIFLCGLALVFGVIGTAGAAHFDVAGAPDSSVTLSNVSTFPDGWTSLDAELVPGLDGTVFDLNHGTTEFDFFTLDAEGLGLGSADISATLAFNSPVGLGAEGNGDVSWGTFFGIISGGVLNWDASTLPDVINVGGETVGIDFEDGVAIVCGDSATVHAYVTVPEPTTMLLLGFGLMGLAGVGRKKFFKK